VNIRFDICKELPQCLKQEMNLFSKYFTCISHTRVIIFTNAMASMVSDGLKKVTNILQDPLYK
jgi:hypothetical protein